MESADWEGETPLPLPIGRVKVEIGVRNDNFWELRMYRNNGCKFYHDCVVGKGVNRYSRGRVAGGLCDFSHAGRIL